MSDDTYTRGYYTRNIPENWFHQLDPTLMRPDQLAAICYTFGLPYWGDEGLKRRKPKKVVSIGCGLGYLEARLEQLGVPSVIGVDPFTPRYAGRTLIRDFRWTEADRGDTYLFVESLEHLPWSDIEWWWHTFPIGARVIVVNWMAYYPLPLNGFDHVTRLDDDLYNQLSAGHDVVVRRNGHLVLDVRR